MASARLNLVVIYSAEREHVRAFYERLGLRFERERHGRGPEHDAAATGEVLFEIYPLSPGAKPAEQPPVRLGFEVEKVESLVEELLEAGGKLITPPQDSPLGKRAVVEDPEQRRIELFEPRRPGHCCG